MLPETPSVLVLDDQQLVIDQLSTLLKSHGYKKVYTAREPQAVKQLFQLHHIDVLVADILLADNQNGIDLVTELKEVYRFLLIFISGQHASMLEKALPVMPDAYLVKPFSDEQIITTLLTTWSNNKRKQPQEAPVLSIREQEILHLICQGRTNKEIAELLSISPFTAQTHRANIREKFSVQNTKELLIKAHNLGLLG